MGGYVLRRDGFPTNDEGAAEAINALGAALHERAKLIAKDGCSNSQISQEDPAQVRSRYNGALRMLVSRLAVAAERTLF